MVGFLPLDTAKRAQIADPSVLVGRARFELAVSWSQTRRFAELSYRPRSALILVSPRLGSSLARAANRKDRAGAAGAQHRKCAEQAADDEQAVGAEPAPIAIERIEQFGHRATRLGSHLASLAPAS